MAARRSRGSRRRSSRRKPTSWIDALVTETAVTAVQGVDLLNEWRTDMGLTMNLPGMAVERVLIHQSAAVSAGTGTYSTGWRLGLVIEAATAEGEVPDPVAEPLAKWMWNTRYYLGNNTVGWLYDGDQHVDIRLPRGRPMRQPAQTLWMMLSPELGGATSLNYTAHVRLLVSHS